MIHISWQMLTLLLFFTTLSGLTLEYACTRIRERKGRKDTDNWDEFGLPKCGTETPMPEVKPPKPDFSQGGDMGKRIIGECGGPEYELNEEWIIDKSNIVFESATADGTVTKFYGFKRKKPSPYRYC